jgi:hypothetical protein
MANKKRDNEDLDLNLTSGQKARFTRLYNDFQEDAKRKLKDLDKLYNDFTSDSEGNSSFLTRMKELESRTFLLNKEITQKISAIQLLHDRINTADEENGTSISQNINDFLEEYEDKLSDITSLRNQFVAYKKELEGFEDEEGVKIPGLKDKILSQAKDFDKHLKEYQLKNESFLKENENKFSSLKEKIESLLPGASTVGIAKSFEEHKNSFDRPMTIWSIVFMVSLLGMIVYALCMDKSDIKNFSDVGIRILNNIPFFLPAIWIAIYASKQQSQNKRLQQEYAFKEDVAKSYQGFKKEIENLDENDESNELKLQFMQRLVDIIGENPTSTLEHRSHKDRPPIFGEFAEKLSSSKTKDKNKMNENPSQ